MGWDRDRYQQTFFQDQPIPVRPAPPRYPLPERLREARALATELRVRRRSREEIFLAQGELLADYEPEEDVPAPSQRLSCGLYYVTYESLNDGELVCYFVWRTALRRGEVLSGPVTFLCLYLYELLNQIGVSDPLSGFHRLREISQWEGLESSVRYHLRQWLRDYVVYYDLSPSLLGEQAENDQLRRVRALFHGTDRERMEAAAALSSYRLDRSKFYRARQDLFDRVALRVIDRVREHYEKRCKRTMEEDYFGTVSYTGPACLFSSAVFLPRGRQEERTCQLDSLTSYRCEHGRWTVRRTQVFPEPSRKLGDLMKTVDCALRQAESYPHPLKPALSTKWILALVEQEIAAVREEERRRPVFDLSQLARIRDEAAETRDKLLTESELDPPETAPAQAVPAAPAPEAPPAPPEAPDIPLTPEEYRYLQALLYGGDTGWVQERGLLLSVLTDRINEALFDDFGDTVLDETGALIEDYIDELKEMILL